MPDAAVAPETTWSDSGRHDPAERRRATRKQREKGCSIYIPAEALHAAGFTPGGELPFYRTFPVKDGRRATVLVRLYREK